MQTYPRENTKGEDCWSNPPFGSMIQLGSMKPSVDNQKLVLEYSALNYHTNVLNIFYYRCPRDTTMDYSFNPLRSYQEFKVKTFRFFNDYETVYLHCELLACHKYSTNSRWIKRLLSASRWITEKHFVRIRNCTLYSFMNRPFPSYFVPLFQNQSEREIIRMEMWPPPPPTPYRFFRMEGFCTGLVLKQRQKLTRNGVLLSSPVYLKCLKVHLSLQVHWNCWIFNWKVDVRLVPNTA